MTRQDAIEEITRKYEVCQQARAKIQTLQLQLGALRVDLQHAEEDAANAHSMYTQEVRRAIRAGLLKVEEVNI